MARKRALQPANPIHPGAMLLEEFLQPADKSQAAFAREMGWTKARLNEFIKSKRGVTAPVDEPPVDVRPGRGDTTTERCMNMDFAALEDLRHRHPGWRVQWLR